MPIYAYEAETLGGELVADQLAAANVAAAIQALEARGLTVRSIRTVTDPAERGGTAEAPGFYQRIEAALAQRAALVAALEAFADDVDASRSTRGLQELIAELRRGATAQDFIRHDWAATWLPLILRSPASTLDSDGFRQLITQATRESDNRNVRRRMLIYPLTLLVVALVLALTLLYAIVPDFSQMYREFQLRLEGPTLIVMWLSDRLRDSMLLFFTAAVLIATLTYVLIRSWVRAGMTSRLFGSWVAGNSLSVAAMARFTSTLGELLAVDAPLPDAIQIAGRASRHPYYREMAGQLAQEMLHGGLGVVSQIQHQSAAQAFPANVLYALRSGDDGGPNVALLRELSSLYSDRVSQRFDWSAGIIAPLTIAAVGVLVAFFLLALLMPLMSMISGLS